MAAAILANVKKPLPLSCIFHIILFAIIGIVGGSHMVQEDVPEAVIEFEMTAEELAEVEEIQKLPEEQPMFTEQPVPMETVALPESGGAVDSPVAQQAADGSQAVLGADAAVAGGDGAVAAGMGNASLAEGGRSFGGTGTGDGTGDTPGAEDNISTGNTQVAVSQPVDGTESISDIASRFAARVEANKKYPYMALKQGQEGVVTVYATLSAEGALLDSGVSASSGYSSLDNAAQQAVERSCPFSHGAGKTITISVPIHFILS